MFLSYSFTHRRVEFALLEQLARAERQIALAIDSPAYADGSVILATCNRFEIYLETSEERAALLPALLAESTDLPVEMLDAAAETRRGDAVSGHVFGVAAGLDSVALGEEEIAGQLRRAHVAAAARGTLTDGLERLFQAAARTGRAVRARTSIRATGRSLVQLALQRAAPALPPWREVRVLLIGTGAYAGAVRTALGELGAGRVRVYSASGRAPAYAHRHGLEAVAADGLSAALDDADLIVACTRTDEPLLVPADLDRTGDPRVVIDLGMPRNVEAAVGDLPAVELLDLERLAGSMERGPVPRAAEADARRMVDESVSAFALAERDRRAERQAVPALRALRDHVLAVMEQELAHARAQSAAGQISPDRAEAMLRHFAGRLLHEPTTRIRRLGREGRSESANTLVRELFES